MIKTIIFLVFAVCWFVVMLGYVYKIRKGKRIPNINKNPTQIKREITTILSAVMFFIVGGTILLIAALI